MRQFQSANTRTLNSTYRGVIVLGKHTSLDETPLILSVIGLYLESCSVASVNGIDRNIKLLSSTDYHAIINSFPVYAHYQIDQKRYTSYTGLVSDSLR